MQRALTLRTVRYDSVRNCQHVDAAHGIAILIANLADDYCSGLQVKQQIFDFLSRLQLEEHTQPMVTLLGVYKSGRPEPHAIAARLHVLKFEAALGVRECVIFRLVTPAGAAD